MKSERFKVNNEQRALMTIARGPVTYGQITARIGLGANTALQRLKKDGLLTIIGGEYFLTEKGQQARKALDA